MAKDRKEVTVSKNARPAHRGATSALTPHECPVCNERVPQNQLIVVLTYQGKRRQTKGYHRTCFASGG